MELKLKQGAVETHGGELVSFRDGAGTEYIWQGDPAFWSGRNPVLFPIVGNLKDGQIAFGDRLCAMNRHGFARNSQFTIAEQTENRVVLALTDSPETLEQYPYPFRLQVTHTLGDAGFSTAFTVTNTGDGPMPFCIGAHTAFRCPLRDGERFEDYDIVFDHPEQAGTLLLTESGLVRDGEVEPLLNGTDRFPLDRDLFARLDTVIFQGLTSTGVSLKNRITGSGVRMDFTGFPMIAFWTKSGAESPFICLEPWHGCAAQVGESGQFTDKPHVITLSPGETKTLEYTVTIL